MHRPYEPAKSSRRPLYETGGMDFVGVAVVEVVVVGGQAGALATKGRRARRAARCIVRECMREVEKKRGGGKRG